MKVLFILIQFFAGDLLPAFGFFISLCREVDVPVYVNRSLAVDSDIERLKLSIDLSLHLSDWDQLML